MKPIRTSTTLLLKLWTIFNHDLHDQIAPTTRLSRKGTQSVGLVRTTVAEDADQGWLGLIGIDPDHRGKGYGHKAMLELESLYPTSYPLGALYRLTRAKISRFLWKTCQNRTWTRGYGHGLHGEMDFGAKKNVSVSQLDNGNVFYFNLILIYQVKVWPERYRQLKKVN